MRYYVAISDIKFERKSLDVLGIKRSHFILFYVFAICFLCSVLVP